MDLPPLKVVPDMKVKILKEDGSLDYASNMSTITKVCMKLNLIIGDVEYTHLQVYQRKLQNY